MSTPAVPFDAEIGTSGPNNRAIPRPSPRPVETSGPRFVSDIALHGTSVAIRTNQRTITYSELAGLVDDAAQVLGTERRLVLQTATNTVESLVWYLAALATSNPLILIPDCREERLQDISTIYEPDVVIGPDGAFTSVRETAKHDLHPELALMLSTSGSTASPKLVRLSKRNLESNAASIAEYLQIRPSDRAITNLPMAYCYGLSIINSHLESGAGLVLTDLSVVDECFWTLFRSAGATTLAGVPYTFDLLDRVGFADMDLPRLRYVTQAGGRLAPDRVRAYAELGQRSGWDFFVMYGQTEATARMAYLPPDAAISSPEAIGVAVPGGELRLEPIEDDLVGGGGLDGFVPRGGPDGGPVGELVYTGPNVMLGYAESPADLANGHTISELRTGDLARRTPNGLFQIVGRRSQFAKVCGMRIDLERVQTQLADAGIDALCMALTASDVAPANGESLILVPNPESIRPIDGEYIRRAAASSANLAPGMVEVVPLPEIPRLDSGKPNLPKMRVQVESVLADRRGFAEAGSSECERALDTSSLIAAVTSVFCETLNRADISSDSSFVSLGGDSMSYIELSVRLEKELGTLPRGWHVASITELAEASVTRAMSPADRAATARTTRGRLAGWRQWTHILEMNVALRAIAIILVVGSHVSLFDIRGGAHLLIAIAGFNFARFHLSTSDRQQRIRGSLASVRRIVIPSMLWMALAVMIDGEYSFANVFFVHNMVVPDPDNAAWRYWFVEALVYVLIFSVALLAIPKLHKVETRWPFGFVLTLIGVGLVFRFSLIETATGPKAIYTPWMVLFIFAIGWAIAKAHTWPQRLAVLGIILATIPGYSENPTRVAVILVGVSMLLLLPTIRVPIGVSGIAAALATSSLYIYLTHWQIYPLFKENSLVALVAALTFGVGAWWVVRCIPRWFARYLSTPMRQRITRLNAADADYTRASISAVTSSTVNSSMRSS